MNNVASTNRVTGRTVLICMLAFFGVIIAVNAAMIALAIGTLPGTDVDNPYSAGIAYNKEISAARDQEARGWHIAAHVERAPDGQSIVQVDARDASGSPLAGLVFMAQFARPTDRRADHALVLAEREGGVYRGRVEGVAAGQWELIIQAARGSERVFLSRNRLMLQ